MRNLGLGIGAALMLVSNPLWAQSKSSAAKRPPISFNKPRPIPRPGPIFKLPPVAKAPEIDLKTGGSALVLLAGVLFLVGERSRARRS